VAIKTSPLLTLPLLVARIAAHDEHHAAAANNFALVANATDAGADFHGNTRSGGSATNTPRRHHAPGNRAPIGGKRLSIRPLVPVRQGPLFGDFREVFSGFYVTLVPADKWTHKPQFQPPSGKVPWLLRVGLHTRSDAELHL